MEKFEDPIVEHIFDVLYYKAYKKYAENKSNPHAVYVENVNILIKNIEHSEENIGSEIFEHCYSQSYDQSFLSGKVFNKYFMTEIYTSKFLENKTIEQIVTEGEALIVAIFLRSLREITSLYSRAIVDRNENAIETIRNEIRRIIQKYIINIRGKVGIKVEEKKDTLFDFLEF